MFWEQKGNSPFSRTEMNVLIFIHFVFDWSLTFWPNRLKIPPIYKINYYKYKQNSRVTTLNEQ